MRDSFPSMNYKVVKPDGNNFKQEKSCVATGVKHASWKVIQIQRFSSGPAFIV